MKSLQKDVLAEADPARLMETLQRRFEEHPQRHKAVKWVDVAERLRANPAKIASLLAMEHTGGEPDVIAADTKTGEIIFADCSPESPKGRRSLCYDRNARESRKQNKPSGSALEMAEAMGVKILNEDEYKNLQKLGPFDAKTSSWLETPAEIRNLGGAIFGDWRFGRVFVYHNGAESYYAARGWRGLLRV
jgi:hypothetical protein